jgi:hypothetical protein
MRRRLSQHEATRVLSVRRESTSRFSVPSIERSDEVPDQDRHPTPERTEPPHDELVLAAIERAELHRARRTPEVPIWAIVEHLAIPRRSSLARGIRSQLERLVEVGALERSRRRGVSTWALTSPGRRRVQAARLAGQLAQLPESPQHLAWRQAQTAAGLEIDSFRRKLSETLEEAVGLLGAEAPVHSDAWFELGQRVHHDARRLASASHCLYEWAEPRDDRADVDDRREPGDESLEEAERARYEARRVGRRNISLWQNGPGRY